MEIRVNVVLVAVLGIFWGSLCATEPVAALDPSDAHTVELAGLEDRFAQHRDDNRLARDLADRYLALEQPGLAVAVLRAADPEVLEDPAVAHRLARAYESSGRMLDALATADVALARCARVLGAAPVGAVTPVPRFSCSERTEAALEMHADALARMVDWGVADPDHDERARLAYALATRTARVAQY